MMPGQVPVGSLSEGEWFSCSTREDYADLFLINHKTDNQIWAIQFPNPKNPFAGRGRQKIPWIGTLSPDYPVFKREVIDFSFTIEAKPWRME